MKRTEGIYHIRKRNKVKRCDLRHGWVRDWIHFPNVSETWKYYLDEKYIGAVFHNNYIEGWYAFPVLKDDKPLACRTRAEAQKAVEEDYELHKEEFGV